MANQSVTRTVNLVINGKQAKVSMNELSRSVSAASSAFRKLKESDNPQLYAQRKAQLQKLIQTRKELNAEIYGGAKANKTFLNGFKTSFAGNFLANIATQAVAKLGEAVSQGLELAEAVKGVKPAFDDLNSPELLDDLRTATSGTVSDLELMKSAVKANNFKIPLEKLGGFFAFATKRATETGESVDYLTESIINGIARKSLPILDNLGFSSTEVREEMKKTGDMATAVGNIIARDMGEGAEAIDNQAIQSQVLNASYENLITKIGLQLLPAMNALKSVGVQVIGFFSRMVDVVNKVEEPTTAVGRAVGWMADKFRSAIVEFQIFARRGEKFYNDVLVPMFDFIGNVATKVLAKLNINVGEGSGLIARMGKALSSIGSGAMTVFGVINSLFEQAKIGWLNMRISINDVINTLAEFANYVIDMGLGDQLGIKPIKLIDNDVLKKELVDYKQHLKDMRAEAMKKLTPSGTPVNTGGGVIPGGDTSTDPTSTSTDDKAAKAAIKAKAARDKELEEIQKGFETINKQREKFLAGNLAKDEKELADLDAKYETQFNKLLAYQQRILELEGISEEERAALISTNNLIKEQLEDAHLAELDRIKTERDTASGLKKAEDDETLRVALLSDRELEIEGINAHYDKLELLAKDNADILELIAKKRENALCKVQEEADSKDVARAKALRAEKQAIAIQAADVLVQLANATAKQGEEMSAFQKAAAITSILVNQGIAIGNALATTSSVTPDNVATGGLAGVAKFLTVSSSIIAAASGIKNILSSADVPTAPQFYGGGLTDVRGEQDGRNYKARNVGSFQSGGRFNSPSVGLIAERGPELVIPNNIYTNPANANVMAGLESAIARQYYSGGATNNVSNVTNNGADSEALSRNTAVMNMLLQKLEEPLVASTYLDLQDLEDAQDRRQRSQSLANYG